MMKIDNKYLVVFLIICGCALFNKGLLKAEEEKKGEYPKIEFESKEYNFGKIKEGEKVRHFFKFKNIGNGILYIKRVISTCDCTTAIASKEKLLPNEEGEIEVVFDSTKKVTNEPKLIRVHSNDPYKPPVLLTMRGEVIPEIEIIPEEINFGKIKRGEKDEIKRVKISFPTNDKLTVTNVKSGKSKYITPEIVSKENNETIIEVKIKKDAPVERLKDVVHIFTTSKIYPVKQILVVADIEGDIIIKPEFLLIGNVNGKDTTWTKEIILSKQQKGYFKIKKVEDTNMVFATEVLTLKEGKEYKIKLTLKPNLPTGKVMGKLKIYTNLSYQPIIEIPVYGMIREG